ncbi:MAG: asparagine synthase (glutamine-hydrolyzing), partial [Myxococcota bacterium]|nr:asparagine synthase (glutamine-hydrolyzing) [Myxococcota bacterium]
MCGIAGCIDFGHRATSGELASLVGDMASALAHRGPDDSGIWVDAAAGCALGHRRLSIIDLSPAGHQPMVSPDGRYVIVFNGEIYNYIELRNELLARGHVFRGHSDTETILAATREWGFEHALERYNGMFAIALWDATERCLYLARDRFGEKPLYYGTAGGCLVFGSELKALRAHPRFDAVIDRDALTQFLRFGYVPAPGSIFTGIRKLPPATWLRIREPTDVDRSPEVYWSLSEVVQHGIAHRFTGSNDEAVDELDRLLRDSIRLRMISDVPLGAFLSGGIDSSTVVALMQAQSDRPVRTFTIGTHDRAYNEAEMASAVARHLGTDHTELYVTASEAQAVIPRLPALYDEPFADSSQIPTFLVAQLARQQVTVALSGDAGDELFGGYTRYFWAEKIWRSIRGLPLAVRKKLASAIRGASSARWDSWFERINSHLPAALQQRTLGDKLQKVAGLMGVADRHELYLRLASTWKDPDAVVLRGSDRTPRLTRAAERLGVTAFSEQMMFADTLSYLPDDILVKVDRATMGVSLEGRVPLLDPRLVSFAWQLSPISKVRFGRGKLPLRGVLSRYVPAKLFDRPKMGFGVPIGHWLRGPLRDWAEDLLDERRLRTEGFLDPAPIRAQWLDHVKERRNAQYSL